MNASLTGSRFIERILIVLLALQCTLFCWSLFGHLSYPLFWNDEGMTVMGSRRVLEHGYPLAWDGKNLFYDLRHPDKKLGLDERTGAYIGGSGWGHYYFGAIPVWLADRMFTDIYARTGFIRAWFALAGLAGLILMARLLAGAFTVRRDRLIALNVFVLLVVLSIPLTLHLRDARYYSLSVLLSAAVMALWYRHRVIRPFPFWYYTGAVALLLGIMLFTFSPEYLTFFAAITAGEAALWVQGVVRREEGSGRYIFREGAKFFREFLKGVLPLLLSLGILFPYLSFFRTLEINRKLIENNASLDFFISFSENFRDIADYFVKFEPLWVALALRLFVEVFRKRILETMPEAKLRRKLAVARWAMLCLLLHSIFSAQVPNNIYIRYFVPMIPMLFIMLSADVVIVWRFVSDKMYRQYTRSSFAAALAVGMLVTVSGNWKYISGHVYELRHVYRGHLDYLIPFLQKKFENKKDLIIAANYEETCFMYYLDAKVTIGYVKANINDDFRYIPDAICFNPLWIYGMDEQARERFQKKAAYGAIPFDVRWYRVNNIPEMNYQRVLEHQFRSPEITEEQKSKKRIRDQVYLYVKVDTSSGKPIIH